MPAKENIQPNFSLIVNFKMCSKNKPIALNIKLRKFLAAVTALKHLGGGGGGGRPILQ